MNSDNLPHKELVQKYGFKRFAEMRINTDLSVPVTILDDNIADIPMGIYIWMIDETIVRIGSSKDRLRKRIKSAGRWLELRLQGTARTKSETRRKKELADALRWKKLLCGTGRRAEVWGRSGTSVSTPIGEVNTYLAEENALLQRHKPPLNNSHWR